MGLSGQERERLIDQYARGPERLRTALAAVPPEALRWRPGEGRWSAHEVVVHCADAEANAALRIRYLLAETEPLIVGYDQAEWARALDYASQSMEDALAATELARRRTEPLLRRLTDAQWARRGRHTETGPYDAEQWLRLYAVHLDNHAGQIGRNLAAWKASSTSR